MAFGSVLNLVRESLPARTIEVSYPHLAKGAKQPPSQEAEHWIRLVPLGLLATFELMSTARCLKGGPNLREYIVIWNVSVAQGFILA